MRHQWIIFQKIYDTQTQRKIDSDVTEDGTKILIPNLVPSKPVLYTPIVPKTELQTYLSDLKREKFEIDNTPYQNKHKNLQKELITEINRRKNKQKLKDINNEKLDTLLEPLVKKSSNKYRQHKKPMHQQLTKIGVPSDVQNIIGDMYQEMRQDDLEKHRKLRKNKNHQKGNK